MRLAIEALYCRYMAICASIFKQDDVALDYWLRLNALKPDDAKVIATIAFIYAERGNKQKAVELVRQAINIDPNQPSYWFNLGYLLQELEDHAEAIDAFRRALAMNEKMDACWYGIAISQVKLGLLDEAVTSLKRNTEMQPMSPYGWYQLAHTYCRLGRMEDAEKVVRKLAGFEPKIALKLEQETGIKSGVNLPFKLQ